MENLKLTKETVLSVDNTKGKMIITSMLEFEGGYNPHVFCYCPRDHNKVVTKQYNKSKHFSFLNKRYE